MIVLYVLLRVMGVVTALFVGFLSLMTFDRATEFFPDEVWDFTLYLFVSALFMLASLVLMFLSLFVNVG